MIIFSSGSQGTFDNGETSILQWLQPGQSITQVPEVIPNEGYSFDNWLMEERGSTLPSEQIKELNITGNTTFTAQYTQSTIPEHLTNYTSVTIKGQTDVSFDLFSSSFNGHPVWVEGSAIFWDGKSGIQRIGYILPRLQETGYVFDLDIIGSSTTWALNLWNDDYSGTQIEVNIVLNKETIATTRWSNSLMSSVGEMLLFITPLSKPSPFIPAYTEIMLWDFSSPELIVYPDFTWVAAGRMLSDIDLSTTMTGGSLSELISESISPGILEIIDAIIGEIFLEHEDVDEPDDEPLQSPDEVSDHYSTS
jgi:hypothetical protein